MAHAQYLAIQAAQTNNEGLKALIEVIPPSIHLLAEKSSSLNGLALVGVRQEGFPILQQPYFVYK